MWWILLVEVLCMLVFTALLLHQFADLRRMYWCGGCLWKSGYMLCMYGYFATLYVHAHIYTDIQIYLLHTYISLYVYMYIHTHI